MASPNRMPISRIGRKLITGAGSATLSTAPNQPYSKTIAVAPNAAPTLSR